MTRRTRLFAVAMALAIVQHVWAQNPTMSLIPLVEDVRRECFGGPNDGQACTATADCEVGPECQRVCDFGTNAGMPCADHLDCAGAACTQHCSCNYVLEALPGEIITTEVFASHWSPNGEELRSWQAVIDMRSASSAVLPVGWDRPLVGDFECSVDEDCPAEHPFCSDFPRFCHGVCSEGEVCRPVSCLGIGHCAEEGGFVDTSRADFVFFGSPTIGPSIDYSTIVYRYGSIVIDSADAPIFTSPKYLGSLILRVLAEAAGRAVITLGPRSELADVSSVDIGPVDLESLIIEIVEAPPPSEDIPAASTWGLVALSLVLLAGARVCFGRRSVAA